MKPRKIILIRHGQSEGNVNKKVYNQKPDHVLALTETGMGQARAAAHELIQKYPAKSLMLYSSSFKRARQTADIIRGAYQHMGTRIEYRDEPRLREQEWATCMRAESKALEEKEREKFSKFYYRFKSGESCADLYDGRLSTFCDTVHRDFEKKNFPEVMVVSGHGMSNRVLFMRWFHILVEDFERMKNPGNCEYYVLSLLGSGKYEVEKGPEYWASRETIYV